MINDANVWEWGTWKGHWSRDILLQRNKRALYWQQGICFDVERILLCYKPFSISQVNREKLNFEQKVISNLSRKNRNIYPLLYTFICIRWALDSLLTNTHKQSHIIIYFNGLVIQQISYCFGDYNCRSTSLSSLYSLSSALVVLEPYGPMHTITPALKLLRW